MPARRNNRLSVRQNTDKTKDRTSKLRKVILFSLLAVVLAIFIKVLFVPKYWNENEKLSVAVWDRKNVSVYVFDPTKNVLSEIIIPGEVEVESAFNLGIWKLSAIWELGENENKDGMLLTRTLTNHFKFPVYAWADGNFGKLVKGNYYKALLTVISPMKTNLSYGDRLKIALFNFKVNGADRETIDLSQSVLLKESQLRDGNKGFVTTGFDSPRIYSEFNKVMFSGNTVRVMIRDASGKNKADDIGEIMEVLGTKVASIVKEDVKDINCEVAGSADMVKAISEVANTLGCDIDREKVKNNFDLVILVGSKY